MAEQGREDELADAWRAGVAAAGVDPEDPCNTVGVSYTGPDREWLWTAWVQRSNA